MGPEIVEAGRPAFDVNQLVKHNASGAICVVLARSIEPKNGEWFYHVRCLSHHELGVERWWNERALDVAPSAESNAQPPPPWWQRWFARSREIDNDRERVVKAGSVHIHLTDKHYAVGVGGLMRISLLSSQQTVHVCSNPDCLSAWMVEPVDGCPRCKPVVGAPWRTRPRLVTEPPVSVAGL